MSFHSLIAHIFLVLNDILSTEMYYSLFICSPTEGYFGSFQVLVIMNEVSINMFVQVFV